jgi:hypothetical protein
MGKDALGLDDSKFWNNMEDLVIICIKKDKTINLKTSVVDMAELKSIFSTAYMMTMFQDMKSSNDGIDKLQ